MFKSGTYNLLASLTRLGVSLFSLPLLIHFLGAKSFGLLSIINSVVAFIALAEGSIALATTVFISNEIQGDGEKKTDYRSVADACFSATLLLAFFFLALLYLTAPILASFYQQYGQSMAGTIVVSLRISAFVLFLRIVQQYYIGILQAHHQYGIYNSSFTLYFILGIVGNVILAWLEFSIVSFFVWQTLLTCLSVVFYAILCRRKQYTCCIIPSVRLKIPLLKNVLLYCSRTWPGNIGGLLFTQGDKLIVGKLIGLEVAGIYAALTSITYQINIHSSTPVQPIVAYLKGNASGKDHFTNYSGSHTIISKSIFTNAAIVLLLGSSVILFSEEITEYFLRIPSNSFYEVPDLLSALALIYALYSLNAVGYFTLFAVHKELVNTLISLGSSVFTIVLIYVGAKFYGFTGAVWGNVGYFVSLLQIPFAFKYIGYKSNLSNWLYLLVSGTLLSDYLLSTLTLTLFPRLLLYVVGIVIFMVSAKPYFNSVMFSILSRYAQKKVKY